MYKTIVTVADVVQESHAAPVFVFKHDARNEASSAAKATVDMFMRTHPGLNVYLVAVDEQGRLSDALESELGIQHVSPQLLVLQCGAVAAVLNHQKITLENVKKAFSAD